MAMEAAQRGVFKNFPPLPQVGPQASGGKFVKQQRQEVFALRDFHAYEMLGEPGEPVMATSPRAAMRRCALLKCSMGCESDFYYDESEGTGDNEGEVEVPDALSSSRPDNSAIYCEYCEMWLNGPTQYEDHKIGKKHKKNYRKSEGKQHSAPEKTVVPKPTAPEVARQGR